MAKCLIVALLALSACRPHSAIDETIEAVYGIAGSSYKHGCKEAGGVDCDQRAALFVETMRESVNKDRAHD